MFAGNLKNDGRQMRHGAGGSGGAGLTVSRRSLLGGLGAIAAIGGLTGVDSSQGKSAGSGRTVKGNPLPKGRALRVQPALMYGLEQRKDKTS